MTDFTIADHGSVFLIRPMSEAARQWLGENVVGERWQWLGGALAVEHRCARHLLAELTDAGFAISD